MIINKIKYLWGLIPCIALLAGSCSTEDMQPEKEKAMPQSLTVTAFVKQMGAPESRASVNELNYDGWSYRGFESMVDTMGFYSSHGDYYVDNGDGPVINLPLQYLGNNQFRNDNNFVFSPSKMTPDGIFMYFPYCSDMLDVEGGPDNAEGMELRRLDEGYYKCIDFLDNLSLDVGALAYGSITGTFQHAFSELIIMRGEGFNNPPVGKEDIWVIMQNPYTHIKINFTEEPSWSCYPEIVYDPSYVPEGFTGTFNANKWQAWQGGNYSITMQDEGVPAWYVLLPCIGENNTQFTVSAIELYDNDGNLQNVTSLKLSERQNQNGKYTKILKEHWRFPVVVEMKELVPTVNPYPITPWQGDTDITNQRTRGISNAFDFQAWLNYYLAYLNDGEYDNLLQYGDRIVDSTGKTLYWHFYLLDNIDLSEMNSEGFDTGATGSNYLIPKLTDILDGVNMNEMENNLHPNFSISGLTRPFVGQMSGYGALQNIDFISPNIITELVSPTGILVNNMSPDLTSATGASGGLIDNCSISSGTLMAKGPVGAIVGYMEDATITNCTVSAFITGSTSISNSPYLYLVGSQTGANTVEDNEANVIFTND